ncbi:MAG: hypothetical protein QOF61_833 [Acidobacteriota bacterium]|nr:hypothetical protein [Acidobacteriota bacterium]
MRTLKIYFLCVADYRSSALKFSLAFLALLFVTATPLLAQSNEQPASQPQTQVEQLRGEVQQLRGEIERLRALVEKPSAGTPVVGQTTGASAAQSTAAPDSSRVAVATKAEGGDLSGAGNLLRTDRLTIGGYGDAQFRGSGVNEKADGGGTPTFAAPRLVLAVAATLSEKHNIFFNSEIEYEFAGKEVEVEQAFLEWKVRPAFAFRGGVIVPALGRFNVYHDSNLNLTAIRPLLNQFVVPTAYSDTGVGVRGKFKLPRRMKLSYEFDLVNGMRSTGDEEGGAAPFSRLLGQAEAAHIGNSAFQDNNRNKALVGRVGFSPFDGFEFGVSGYRGRVTDDDEPRVFASLFFFDASYRRKNLLLNAEYGRSRIVGAGVARRSPRPPVFDPADEASATALADFLAQPAPGQDGFYVEGSYQFRPRFVAEHFDEGGYVAPVVRYEGVRLDRTLRNFYLNRTRLTVGLNVAPSSSAVFKFNYLFNRTAAPVPRLAGELDEEFGLKLLPFRGYGRSGFGSSFTYIF